MKVLMEDPLYVRAYRFAEERHTGQTRKDALATPYIQHPVAVSCLLMDVGGIVDVDILAAALLHDVIEDTITSAIEIERLFGPKITRIVQEVSDDKRLPKMARKYLQVRGAPFLSNEARQVKLGDKICNLLDILESPPKGWLLDRKIQYFEWAKAVIDGLRGSNASLEHHFDVTYARKSELR
jgi:GTP diphosphokinase / guanosine-3',5'-bis(diphosphate) 3'-diphosphatase